MTAVGAPLGFRDVSLIGVGATSRVYRATQGGGRVVALKRLHRQLVQDAEALARLKRELESLAQLDHPNIVRFIDVVRWEGDPTLVMELVEGADLKALVEAKGPLPIEAVERAARELLSALSAVHAAGIVHRDLKPQNVRVRSDGRHVLLDFGSARLDAASQLTKTGSTLGTPEYMGPELFVGSVYDPRADIYGLGATLYELLTGQPPHRADTLAELAFLRSETPAAPVRSRRSDCPAALAQVVDRALEIAPHRRFPSAALALWALDHPDEERRMSARRRRLPRCVHCDEPNAPEAGRCSACGSGRPFVYELGRFHVVIDSVASRGALAAWIAERVPERATPQHLEAHCELAAATSFAKQRLVSFVSEEDAKNAVASLERARVHAHVAEEMGKLRWLALPILLQLLSLGGLSPLAVAWGLGVSALAFASGALASRRDILLQPRLPRSFGPAPERALLVGAALAFAWILGLGEPLDAWTFDGAFGLSALAVTLFGVLGSRLGPKATPKTPGPERAAGERLLQAAAASIKPRPASTALVERLELHPILSMTLLLAVLALIPLEFDALGRVEAQLSPIARIVSASTPPSAEPVDPLGASTASEHPPPSIATSPSADAREGRRGLVRVLAGHLISALALLWLLRYALRWTRVRRDAALALAELPSIPRVSPPHRARGSRRAEPLLVPHGDDFLDGFARRASVLAPILSPASVDRAVAQIRAIPGRVAPDSRLLAQCVMETDSSYALRFRLLELEGELEAEAARAWAEELD